MGPLGDFFARILSAGDSRGLSGDSGLVLPSVPALTGFNERLRRHATADDLVAEPERLWDTSGYLSQRKGLRGHLLAERGSGVVGISDVLLIINQEDWRRSFGEQRRPWAERAKTLLAERFRSACESEDLHLAFPERPVGFAIVEDGGEEMGGHTLGLTRGEFVTGLLPNHHTGPGPGARAVVTVHLLLPGVWDTYRAVGTLWSDQVLLTLGAHWLDNVQHPALREPALYRLHRRDDGSFVHVLNPELRGEYRLSSQETPGGASVLTVETRDGDPVAYLVLEVLPAQAAAPSAANDTPSGPSPEGRPAGSPSPRGLQPGSQTMVPQRLTEPMLSLQERGALLQKVHFGRFMEGYDVFLGPEGEVATSMSNPAATLHVRGRQVSLEAHVKQVQVGGQELHPDQPIFLSEDTEIRLGGATVTYRDLSRVPEDGWPYLGELRRDGASAHLVFGQQYQIGRDARCTVKLPDEPHNDNIIWRPELRGGGTIRSRNGEIPKSRFYIDSIMVASEHAEVDLVGEPRLLSRARHCFTYVRRGEAVHPLYPTKDGGGPMELELQAGDEILIGNCVFEARFVTPENHVSQTAAPEPLAAPSAPQEGLPGGSSIDPMDVPAAAGLGEAGAAPRAVEASLESADSIIGDLLPRPPRAAPPMVPVTLAEFSAQTAHPHAIPIAPAPAADPGEVPAGLSEGLDETLLDSLQTPPAPVVPLRSDPDPGAATGTPSLLDPTGIPLRAPPPVALESTADSILGDLPLEGVPSKQFAGAPPPSPTPPVSGSGSAAGGPGPVAVVDEADWQLELTRPARFILEGFMVSGTCTVGNHAGADIVLPENQERPGQVFSAMDYLQVSARGKRAKIEVLAPTELRITEGGLPVSAVADPDAAVIAVLRRDADGEEDFRIPLSLERDNHLPDPRARLLSVDLGDRMVRALFTLGLPLRQHRSARLGALSCRVRFDGDCVELSDYLPSYRPDGDRFLPVFVTDKAEGFRTLPEDGSLVRLAPGDRLISGCAVYRFEG